MSQKDYLKDIPSEHLEHINLAKDTVKRYSLIGFWIVWLFYVAISMPERFELRRDLRKYKRWLKPKNLARVAKTQIFIKYELPKRKYLILSEYKAMHHPNY